MLRLQNIAIFIFILSAAPIAAITAQHQKDTADLQVSITHAGSPVACNIKIKNDQGNYFRPDSTYLWKDMTGHLFEEFPCNGAFRMKLPYGNYHYEADRGPAYELLVGDFTLNSAIAKEEWELKEIVDVSKRNWWAGETHIHRNPNDIELLMKASDLHIGEVITSWNENYPAEQASINATPKKFDNNRFYETTASEDERGGGALLFFNLPAPFNFANLQPEYPPLVQSVYRVSEKYRRAWIDIEKPFWQDVPVLLATGKVNSIGIANNHLTKKGVFDSEAWGKKRDTGRYLSPLGNAWWTQDIYYQVLNAGFRIPPSAGSASGVLWNPVGYNRLYAYVKTNLTYSSWWNAVRKGNCFVSNGPLLFCYANGHLPGNVFKIPRKKPLVIAIKAELFSRDSLTKIEVIKNGKVYAIINPSHIKNNRIISSIKFIEGGWFLVRAISTANNNFRFASTGPFYVEDHTGKKMISRSACKFFIQWLNERSAYVQLENAEQRSAVLKSIDEARNFWGRLLKQSYAE